MCRRSGIRLHVPRDSRAGTRASLGKAVAPSVAIHRCKRPPPLATFASFVGEARPKRSLPPSVLGLCLGCVGAPAVGHCLHLHFHDTRRTVRSALLGERRHRYHWMDVVFPFLNHFHQISEQFHQPLPVRTGPQNGLRYERHINQRRSCLDISHFADPVFLYARPAGKRQFVDAPPVVAADIVHRLGHRFDVGSHLLQDS